MKQQIFNPYLPMNEYVPDGEPRKFDGRIYIYGSHDREGGDKYCLLDYVSYSAPETNLKEWRYEGEIYKRSQDPHDTTEQYLWAPDVVQGPDGRYYLYYVLSGELEIGVAVSDKPAGPFAYLGRVSHPDGRVLTENIPFDPGVLVDEGRVYLYYGFAPVFPMPRLAGKELPGASVVELKQDMLTVTCGPQVVLPSKKYAAGTGFEGHAFFEACSARKIDGLYYLIYASEVHHELCYAYSRYPDREYRYGGVVVSNADIGFHGRTQEQAVNAISNNHGGLVEADGKWYIFYHRHTHGTQFSRQGCAEEIETPHEGVIPQTEITSCGLNGGPLEGKGTYSAAIACQLYGKERGVSIPFKGGLQGQPYMTHEGEAHFITHISDGCTVGFKYFSFENVTRIALKLRGDEGEIEVSDDMGAIGRAEVSAGSGFTDCLIHTAPLNGVKPIYVRYWGDGSVDFLSIDFS